MPINQVSRSGFKIKEMEYMMPIIFYIDSLKKSSIEYVTYNLESSIISLFKFDLAHEMSLFSREIAILSNENCKAACINIHKAKNKNWIIHY